MPLIQITSQHRYYPAAQRGSGTISQMLTADLARALPELFVSKSDKLHMEPGTLEAGVQVTHQKFHGQDVNTPDIWVLVQFSESGLTKKQQLKAKSQVKKLLTTWLGDNMPENFAVDCFWGPSHGFLNIGGKIIEW